MDANKPAAPDPDATDSDALEPKGEASSLETGDSQNIDATGASGDGKSPKLPAPKRKSFLKRFNIYLLIFLFILVIAGAIVLIAYFQSQQAGKTTKLKTQALTQNALNQLASSSDATVGNTQQVLSVQSSAVFAGKVLVRQDLEVAGNLQIGGTVGLSNLTVSGNAQFGQTQITKDLSVSGNTAVQGSLSTAKSLQVNGTGNFSGPLTSPQIATSDLQLNADFTFTHHLVIGGGTPSRSNGTAVGSGGSASVSGSDTAGTVSINVGSGPAAGCFINVNFTQKFNSVPRVLVTPVGSAGGGLSYYTTRTNTGFSLCVSTPAPAGSSFAFDYFVVG